MINSLLSTSRTKLVPLEESDFETLYEWLTNFDYNMLWSNIREFPRKNNFFELLKHNIENEFTYYFIIKNNDNKDIGTIFIHDFNKIDQYASISTYILPEFQNSFFGIDSYKLVFNFIIQNLPIRKLYLDAFSYNNKSIRIIEKVGFQLEGVFKKHRYYKGDYHNLNRYSLFLSEWKELEKRHDK